MHGAGGRSFCPCMTPHAHTHAHTHTHEYTAPALAQHRTPPRRRGRSPSRTARGHRSAAASPTPPRCRRGRGARGLPAAWNRAGPPQTRLDAGPRRSSMRPGGPRWYRRVGTCSRRTARGPPTRSMSCFFLLLSGESCNDSWVLCTVKTHKLGKCLQNLCVPRTGRSPTGKATSRARAYFLSDLLRCRIYYPSYHTVPGYIRL